MSRFRYILGVLIMVGLPPGVAWWFLVHPFVGFWRKVGVRGTMTVMIIFIATAFMAVERRRYLTARILMGVPEVATDADKHGKLLEEGPYACQ
jgi:hypothetical protein